jgi:hypothetical protein
MDAKSFQEYYKGGSYPLNPTFVLSSMNIGIAPDDHLKLTDNFISHRGEKLNQNSPQNMVKPNLALNSRQTSILKILSVLLVFAATIALAGRMWFRNQGKISPHLHQILLSFLTNLISTV